MTEQNLYISLNLAEAIKKQAKIKGVVLATMLTELNLGSNTMSNMRHGRMIAADSLAKIADYLDCSVDYLLGRTDDPCISSQSVTSLTAHEQEMVAAYRSHPEARPAVDKLLGVTENGTVLLYTAAKSSDNVPPERIELPQKRWEEFENTPKADSTEPN